MQVNRELFAQDEVIRNRGALIAAAETDVVSVRAWDAAVEVVQASFADLQAPLAGGRDPRVRSWRHPDAGGQVRFQGFPAARAGRVGRRADLQ
jgi:hypothetical protein